MFGAKRAVDWTAYAAAYDLMADANPAYRQIVQGVATVASWNLAPGDRILDAGAGTGNLSIALARALPQCTVILLDASAGMCAVAERKARQAKLTNHHVLACDLRSAQFCSGSLAAITAVHSLYAIPDPGRCVRLFRDWLLPGGHVFACDPGRKVDLVDWTFYLLREVRANAGTVAAARLLWNARSVLVHNHRIRASQSTGAYWLHDELQFRAAFEGLGLVAEQSFACYRGYSDVVVSRKQANLASCASGT